MHYLSLWNTTICIGGQIFVKQNNWKSALIGQMGKFGKSESPGQGAVDSIHLYDMHLILLKVVWKVAATPRLFV